MISLIYIIFKKKSDANKLFIGWRQTHWKRLMLEKIEEEKGRQYEMVRWPH